MKVNVFADDNVNVVYNSIGDHQFSFTVERVRN